jgi:hypothetical protein
MPSASQTAWCSCSPHSISRRAPNSWPAIGPTAITTPMKPTKIEAYAAAPTASAARSSAA